MKSLKILFAIFFVLLISGRAQAQNLLLNGDFEAGLANWTTWAAPAGFWDGAWLQNNDCVIWVPTNGCPYAGSTSYSQSKGSGAGNAHGGIYQVLNVEAGRSYTVSGFISGGVTGNIDTNNGSWWEVVAYDGVVDNAVIDAGLRAQDTQIFKREINNLSSGGVSQFQWQGYTGSFVAQSNTVTLALKTGSYYTFDAAAYHDNISVTAVPLPAPVPTLPTYLLITLMLVLPGLVVLQKRRSM